MSGVSRRAELSIYARLGVHEFLDKPFSVEDLVDAVSRAVSTPVDLAPVVAQTIGAVGLCDVKAEVQRVMLEEALARTRGNKTAAADVLKVTRQAVQRSMRK